MNSRERVLAAINHREADRVPIDVGGTRQSGIAASTYHQLKERLGINTPTRVYDLYQILAEIEQPILLNDFEPSFAILGAGLILIVIAVAGMVAEARSSSVWGGVSSFTMPSLPNSYSRPSSGTGGSRASRRRWRSPANLRHRAPRPTCSTRSTPPDAGVAETARTLAATAM